jgi:hypothetical protein
MRDKAGKMALSLLFYLRLQRASSSQIEQKEIRDLPPDFVGGSGNDERWWEMAKKSLLFSYPEPQNIEEFESILTPTERKHIPRTRRRDIIETLRKRFLSFARKPLVKSIPQCDCGRRATRRLADGWVCDRCDGMR